jgi:putative membrane protein
MNFSTIRIVAILCLSAGCFSFAFAQQSASSPSASASGKSSPMLTSADAKFMKEAADGGLAEMELGQLATEKASSEDVKNFGQRMVDDHGKANDKLKDLASQKSVTLPDQPSAKHKTIKMRLEKMFGTQFDQAYVAEMTKDHKKDVAEFERESKSAHDPDVKNFAIETLPTLQDHLKQIQNISSNAQSSSAQAK